MRRYIVLDSKLNQIWLVLIPALSVAWLIFVARVTPVFPFIFSAFQSLICQFFFVAKVE